MLCVLACVFALSIQTSIDLSGRIVDASGGAVADAEVDALVAGLSVGKTTSAADGQYRLQLPAGMPVELRVRRDGFAERVIAVAGSSGNLTRDVTLQVGGVSDTLVVTASRSPQSRASVTESVTSFARADIQALGSASIADVIRFVPGVNLEATGREGALTSMFSRGGESDYNLVLIDGVRANLSGGSFDFSRISAAEIERLEVVRGAQSSLWGSDAMGSVVHIFTNRSSPAGPAQVSGAIQAGSFGTVRSNARVNGGIGNGSYYQGGFSYRMSDGAFADLLPEDDQFDQATIDAAAGTTIGNRATLRGTIRYSDASGRSVGQITYGSRDTGTTYDSEDLSAQVDLTHAVGTRFTGAASFNYFRYESLSADTVADPPVSTYAVLEGTPNAIFPNGTRLVRLVDAGEFAALVAAGALPAPGQFLGSRTGGDFPFSSVAQFRRPAFRYQGDVLFGPHRLSAGYEWERETNPLTAGFELDNNAAFIQQQIAINDRWFATVGGRVDAKESYDTFFSPKLSVGGYLVPLRQGGLSSLKVFGNLGKGIKSPTFGERFGGSFADPAPDLKVERARTGDVGVEATLAGQRFRTMVTYFNNDYVDQIAFRSGVVGDGQPEFINIDGSKADGWEIEWALQRPAAGFTGAVTYALVDNRVVTNISTSQQFQPGQPLLRRPKHSGTVRAAYVYGPISAHVDARIIGQRHDNSFLSLRTVPNAERPNAITTDITVNPRYSVVGIGADYRAHRALTVFLRIDNVGDSDYESALGYPGLPRSVAAGLRFDFGGR